MIVVSTDDLTIQQDNSSFTFANVNSLLLKDVAGTVTLDTSNLRMLDSDGNYINISTNGISYNGIMKVIGKNVNRLIDANNPDINMAFYPGVYRINSGYKNGPTVGDVQWSVMLVVGIVNENLSTGNGASDTLFQIVMKYSNSAMYIRSGNALSKKDGSGWSPWRAVTTTNG